MTPRPGSDTPEADPNGQNPSDHSPSGTATERIIERFGGIRPMAHKLDMPVTTVQGWKKRGAIPLSRHADLRAAAVKHGITLDEADLEAATPAEDRHGTAPAPDHKPDDKPEDKLAQDKVIDSTVPDSKVADAAETTAAPSEPAPVITPPATPEIPATAEAEERERARTYSLPPRPVEKTSGGAGFATAVSLLALLVGAAALTQPWWGPTVMGGNTPTASAPANDGALRAQIQQITDRVAKLEQRPAASNGTAANGASSADLQALAGKVTALEQRVASAPAPVANNTDAVKALTDRLAALEQKAAGGEQAAQQAQQLAQRIAGLEQKVGANAAAAQEVSTLKQEVAGLAKQAEGRRDAAANAQALVLAAGQLRGALAGSQPFQGELQAVQTLAGGDAQVKASLDAVAPYAPKGIPTQAQLAERFDPLANDIVKAAQKGEASDWIDQVTGTLSTLVTVRRQGGGIVGDTPQATVARAEAAMQQGNLAVAVEELSKLQGPAAQAAGGWLADARARLAANQASQQLTGRAIAALTAAGGAKPEGSQ
ncbi:COG4223 family protein [Azospirillum sp.]|uniref:COG4223 family protein n=1 Tax=Azospirillum sp. TaxID=34012 RepID=UPI002D6E244D|nr:mitofilin family membrane protein [Azospirillum sp.]HYD70672.1 mitofilin family membrane protein [Azospirillum sp.]